MNQLRNESASVAPKIGNGDVKPVVSYATACKRIKPIADKSLNQPTSEDRIW